MVSIILLAILAIGAVSASEDIMDDTITAIEPSDDVVVEESLDDSPLGDSDDVVVEESLDDSPLGDDPQDLIDVPYAVSVGEQEFITVKLPNDYNGEINVYNTTRINGILMADQIIASVPNAKGLVKIPLPDVSPIWIYLTGDIEYDNYYFIGHIENREGFSASMISDAIEYGEDALLKVDVEESTTMILIYDGRNKIRHLGFTEPDYSEWLYNLSQGEHISGLSVGDHRIQVSIYYNAEIYVKNLHVTVSPPASGLVTKVYNDTIAGYEGESDNTLVRISQYVPKSGNITISLNGIECYNEELVSEVTSISLNSLKNVKSGLCDLVVKLVNDDGESVLYDGKVYIDYLMGVNGLSNGTYLPISDPTVYKVILPEDVTGTVKLDDGIKTHTLKKTNGVYSFIFELNEHPLGRTTFTLSLTDDPVYRDKSVEYRLFVEPMLKYQKVVSSDENEFLTIVLPDNFVDDVCIYEGSALLSNGNLIKNLTGLKGSVDIPLDFLNLGTNMFYIDIPNYDKSAEFIEYIQNDPKINVGIPSNGVEMGSNAVLELTVPNSTYNVSLIVDDSKAYNFSGNTKYSKDISNLGLGKHKIKVLVSFYDAVEAKTVYLYSNQFSVNVKPAPVKIVAKDYSAYYNKGTYSVTVYGTDGKVAKNTTVVFKINGKKVATVKTNSKGVAKLKIPTSYVPKTYKISATALGKTVTKKLTVKQVLTLKAVTIKKSAKKLVISATLKEGKNAIKSKKITFKFNGKTYTAKTNKKGVAKITIKKSVLKKLKVGKKVVYQATYIKDTVKKTAKVKK